MALKRAALAGEDSLGARTKLKKKENFGGCALADGEATVRDQKRKGKRRRKRKKGI